MLETHDCWFTLSWFASFPPSKRNSCEPSELKRLKRRDDTTRAEQVPSMPSTSDSDEEPAQLAIVEQELQRSATLSAARSVEFNSLREDVSSARTANDQVVKKLQASLQRSEVEALASRAEASQLREAKNLASEQLEVAVVQREMAVRQREAAAAAVLEEEERAAVARRETEARLRDEAQHEAARRRELESRLREVEATLEEQKAAAAASLSTSIASLTDPSRTSPERRAGGSANSPDSTALTTASAAARRGGAAAAPGGGGALLADHAQLTQQFHVLKRRFDAVVADKGRLQAEAAKRDRELQREAAALRSALLAAGAAGGRGGAAAAAAAAAPHYLAATTALVAPSPSLSPPSALRGGGGDGGSTLGGGSDGARRRGGGAEAEADASSLRRRVSDLSADNALLTQNFMMVKARLSDVCAQKEAALSEMQLSCTQLEATLHTRLAAAMRAQQATPRPELTSTLTPTPTPSPTPAPSLAGHLALRAAVHRGGARPRPTPQRPPRPPRLPPRPHAGTASAPPPPHLRPSPNPPRPSTERRQCVASALNRPASPHMHHIRAAPQQVGLTAALWRWHRSICALRRADTETLSTSVSASKHSALQLLGRRLVSAANVVRPATANTANTASTASTASTANTASTASTASTRTAVATRSPSAPYDPPHYLTTTSLPPPQHLPTISQVRGAREAVGLSHALRRWASVAAGEALNEAAQERTRRRNWCRCGRCRRRPLPVRGSCVLCARAWWPRVAPTG